MLGEKSYKEVINHECVLIAGRCGKSGVCDSPKEKCSTNHWCGEGYCQKDSDCTSGETCTEGSVGAGEILLISV